MKNVFVLILLGLFFVSCVGSPTTIQVAKDVNGNVVQDANSVETHSVVSQPQQQDAGRPASDWAGLFVSVCPIALFAMGLMGFLLTKGSESKNKFDKGEW